MRQQQKGFTLIELVLAVGIVAAVVLTISMTLTTLMMNFKQPSTQPILLQQARNAGYHIPRDIQMSSDVTLSDPNGFPLIINIPVDQDENNDYTVKYLFYGNTLERKQYDSLDILTAESLIAQYVDTGNTTFESITENITGALYKLTIRVSMDEEAVTASYEVQPRL